MWRQYWKDTHKVIAPLFSSMAETLECVYRGYGMCAWSYYASTLEMISFSTGSRQHTYVYSFFTYSVQLHNYHTSYIFSSPPLSLLCVFTFTDFMIFSRNILIIKTGNFWMTIKQLWRQLTVTCLREMPRNCILCTIAEQWLYVRMKIFYSIQLVKTVNSEVKNSE